MENTNMTPKTNATQNVAAQPEKKTTAKKRPPRKSNGAPQKKSEPKAEQTAEKKEQPKAEKPASEKKPKEKKGRASSRQERLDRVARVKQAVVLNGTIEFETDATASRGAGSATVLYEDCLMFVKRRENLKPVRVIELWTHVPLNDILVSKKLFASLMESHSEFSGYMEKVNDKKSKSKLVFQLSDEDTLPFIQLLIDSI